MLFNILALISLLTALLLLKTLVGIFPSLLACMIRWKESVNLDASVQLSRDRDITAIVLIIPFCLMVSRFGLYDPSFIEPFNQNGRIGIILGIFIMFVLIRTFIEHLLRKSKINQKTYKTACRSSYSFFSILTLLLLLTGGILSFIDVAPEAIRNAMLWISATIYGLSLLRKTQILTFGSSFFTGFLYLCALEIIPTGALVASAIIF